MSVSIYLFYLALVFLLGLCVGSFLNVLIYRLPLKESINFPASHCTSCNHKLKWWHNIPLFSYIFLGAKCSFCKEKISIQYPIIELLSAIVAVICYMKESSIFSAIFITLCFFMLLALSAIDFKYKAVPDSLLIASLIFSTLYIIYPKFELINLEAGIVFAFIFWLLRFVVSLFMKREAMGSADIFIAAVIGLVLGFKLAMIAIYIGSILTLPAYMIARKKIMNFLLCHFYRLVFL